MEAIVKQCNKCKIEKPITAFYKDERYRYGVMSVCKDCAKLNSNIRYQENREAISEKQKIRRQSGDVLCSKCGERNAVNNSECDPCHNFFRRKPDGCSLKKIDYFTLRDGDKCAYCSDELQHGVKGEVHFDHIVPTPWRNGMGSHHVSNVVMCCRRCNKAKFTASLDVFASRAMDAGYWSPAPYVEFLVGKTTDQLRAMGLVREHRDPVDHPFAVVNDGDDLNEGLFAGLGE